MNFTHPPICVLPCAGSGQRARTALPKQYELIAGLPMVIHTLRALLQVSELALIAVVVSPHDEHLTHFMERYQIDSRRVQVWPCGGTTRALSVQAGLSRLLSLGHDAQTWVLVHDAARCLIDPKDVSQLIRVGCTDEVGALLGRPMSDTVKRVELGQEAPRVCGTEDRNALWIAQTPQMFRLGALHEAYERAGPEVTDEASAMQVLAKYPRLVPAQSPNLKVTYAQDFDWAQAWLAQRQKGGDR